MPDLQEAVALAIVALVAGVLAWRRLVPRSQRRPSGGTGCDGCGPRTTPPGEATVRFYRRQNDEGPARGPSQTSAGPVARQGSGADATERETADPEGHQ
jgi:hypothetical protein